MPDRDADASDGDVLSGGRADQPDGGRGSGRPGRARRGGQPRGGRPWWTEPAVRSAALVAAGLVVVLLVSQSGLLSAENDPEAGGAGAGGRLVVLTDGHLAVAVEDGWSDGPGVPDGVDSATDLVAATMPSGRSLLVGAAGGELFRVDPAGDQDWVGIGRAARVVGPTGALGTVAVERPGGHVVEVDVRTGETVGTDPFPGYEPLEGWRPAGLLAVGTGRSLLTRRRLGDGLELGLAATERAVRAGARPPFALVGAVPRLLGTSPDTVLATTRSCPGPLCRVLVVTITPDRSTQRAVEPPRGWRFSGSRTGRSAQGLLALRGPGGGPDALARTVAGGDSALLVGGSAGVDLSAGLVDDLDGTTYLVVQRASGGRALRAWEPGSPARLRPVPGPAPAEDAELVCACG